MIHGFLISFFVVAAVFALAVMVTGCAQFTVARSAVAAHGAQAAPDKADGWKKLCGKSVVVP